MTDNGGGWLLLGSIAQALGLVAAAYVAATYGLRQWSRQEQNRELDRKAARLERTIDVLTAIEAEVAIEVDALSAYFSPQRSEALRAAPIERIKIMSGRMMFGLEDIRAETGHVPEPCIGDVVEFYKNNARLDVFSAELSNGGFARFQGENQRQKIVGVLIHLGEEGLRSGNRALHSLRTAKETLRREQRELSVERRFE